MPGQGSPSPHPVQPPGHIFAECGLCQVSSWAPRSDGGTPDPTWGGSSQRWGRGEGNPEGGYDRGAGLRRVLGSPHSNAEPGKVVEEGRSAAGSPGGPLGQCRGLNHIPLTAGPSHPAWCPLCPERGHSCWEGPGRMFPAANPFSQGPCVCGVRG